MGEYERQAMIHRAYLKERVAALEAEITQGFAAL